MSSEILHITGKVIPVTVDKHTLVMEDGTSTVRGEYKIIKTNMNRTKPLMHLEPKASINTDAKEAILDADLIVIAPGNLYGSLIPIFCVDGVAEAISASKAKTIQITNLVNKPGQTDDWHVADYIEEIERYIGKDQIDIVLYNTEPISKKLLEKYAEDKEFPVEINDNRFSEISAKPVGGRLVSKEISAQDPNDKKIQRTLIRHDGVAICRQLMRIYYE